MVRLEGELVFPSARGTPITGWTKHTVTTVAKALEVDFTMHDTQPKFRTGLSRLRVDRDTAELCLGHWRGDLLEAYDRDSAEQRQRDAVNHWAEHVAALVAGEPDEAASPPATEVADNVVPMRVRA